MKTYSKFWIYGRNSCDATVTTLLSYDTMRLVLVFYKALTIFLEWFLIRYSLELPVSLYNLPNRHLVFCSLLLVFLLYYTELMNWFSVSSSRDLFWLCLAIVIYIPLPETEKQNDNAGGYVKGLKCVRPLLEALFDNIGKRQRSLNQLK